MRKQTQRWYSRCLAAVTACLAVGSYSMLLGAEPALAPTAKVAPIATAPATAADRHILWELHGDTSTTYLMGSIHALRKQDYPLPQALLTAYAKAHTLVMELAVNDLDPATMAATMQARGYFPQGDNLRDWLGPLQYARAQRKSAALGINLEQFNRLEPWLAAMTILNQQMLEAGYSPDAGVEAHFAELARQDGKPVTGLESLDEQLAIFDTLGRDEQIQLLLNTLDDAGDLAEGLGTLVDAWKRGDADTLERELKDGFEGLPGMYESLVVRRNQQWLKKIEALAASDKNHLVIVGAMHLVGSDSVIALLEQQGYCLRKL